MLFNSIHFLIFFPCILIAYNLLKDKNQRILLLFASFYFYMVWNTNFVFLLLFSIIVDYIAALQISKYNVEDPKRKLFLIFSLITNLGFLGYFKYTNFFLGTVNDLNFINEYHFVEYNIILPVGISFYTFQSISYTVDVYRGKMEAKKSFVDFALYVSFFPQLVAGPIVRAETFFRDLNTRLQVDYEIIKFSFAQILLGFTKKIVFADNLAITVDFVFKNHASLNGWEVWTGVIAFMWQIYFDFSGYTDIAIGVARLFGFQFDKNFFFPFNVHSISEHWSRWHISFTSWIRDYIFIPLGGSKVSNILVHRNIFLTFMFGGLWHGAAYHYVIWGIWNSIMLSTEREYSKSKISIWLNENGGLLYRLFCRIFTLFCLLIGLPFFRADTSMDSWNMVGKMVYYLEGSITDSFINFGYFKLVVLLFITAAIFEKNRLKNIMNNSKMFTLFILVNFFLMLCFGVTESKSFIYFAF
jgi:alginate O-acetyltransferase complex protein AlgI